MHPEYLYNETNDQEHVLVTSKVDSPEAALEWIRELTGADYAEIGFHEQPVWLKPGPPPEGMEGYCDDGEWYSPAPDGLDDPDAAAYWKTDV